MFTFSPQKEQLDVSVFILNFLHMVCMTSKSKIETLKYFWCWQSPGLIQFGSRNSKKYLEIEDRKDQGARPAGFSFEGGSKLVVLVAKYCLIGSLG